MKHVRSQRFRGHKWCVRYGTTSRIPTGHCEAPTHAGKEIAINRCYGEFGLLELLIHEGLHACFWDLSEEAVDEASQDLATFVWRHGFREAPDDDRE